MGTARRWTRDSIVLAILDLYAAGEDLCYTHVAQHHSRLLRAACRYFRSWRHAVEFAGLPYAEVSKYRRWSGESILARLRELHAQNVDLSWRSVSEEVDPQLAAAASKPQRFGSWQAALEAAGFDYDSIRRYERWDETRIVQRIQELAAQAIPLNSKHAQLNYPDLFAAALRRFGQWDRALRAAGLDAGQVRLRRPFERRARRPQSPQVDTEPERQPQHE